MKKKAKSPKRIKSKSRRDGIMRIRLREIERDNNVVSFLRFLAMRRERIG